jgi:hypothetical protein
MFPDELKNKCKVVILSSSDNKRDIEKIVDNEHVIKFITKPLTDQALAKSSGCPRWPTSLASSTPGASPVMP